MKSIFRFIIFLVIMVFVYLLTRFIVGEGGIPGMADEGVKAVKEAHNDFFGNGDVLVDVDNQKDIITDMQNRAEYATKDLKKMFNKMLGE